MVSTPSAEGTQEVDASGECQKRLMDVGATLGANKQATEAMQPSDGAMPVSAMLSSTRGRPPWGFGGSGGSSAFTFAHSASDPSFDFTTTFYAASRSVTIATRRSGAALQPPNYSMLPPPAQSWIAEGRAERLADTLSGQFSDYVHSLPWAGTTGPDASPDVAASKPRQNG
jgi:hypothetical protein